MVRRTDRPDMTIAVDLDVKQQTKNVFMVSDQAIPKVAFSATENS